MFVLYYYPLRTSLHVSKLALEVCRRHYILRGIRVILFQQGKLIEQDMNHHLQVTRAMKTTLRNVVGGKMSVTTTFNNSFRVGASSKLKNLLDLLPAVYISIVHLNEEEANDGCMEYAQLCQQGEKFLIRRLQGRDSKRIKAIFECNNFMMIACTASGDQDPSPYKILCLW